MADIDTLRTLARSVKGDADQLRRMVGLAAFGGEETGVRVKAPDLLVADLDESADAILALIDENERLRAALTECAAEWRSPPTTIGGAFPYLSVEFQRRMHLAADALAHP